MAFSGLLFANSVASSLLTPSGAAIHLENVAFQSTIACCRFASNSAAEFGGAIYLSGVLAAALKHCEFETNQVKRIEMTVNQYAKGMGGAIASLDSSLQIEHCSFTNDTAQVMSSVFPPVKAPNGCAAGGGDIYIKRGVLSVTKSRFSGSTGGFPMLEDTDVDPSGGNHPEYFTGDGGSILVHCPDPGATLFIANSAFYKPRSFGNGGAICLSYDSSPLGRAYFTTDPVIYPAFSGGVCSGLISSVLFSNCMGGWQGGAISANGRGIQLTIQDSQFVMCLAGTAHKRDGKGGAVSVAGGVQSPAGPQNEVVLQRCSITNCAATGNGGGLYCTVRGRLRVREGTLIQGCTALNAATTPAKDWSEWEGLGGAVYASAGGWLLLSGYSELSGANTAASCGGGMGIKSAHAELEAVTIGGNLATGARNSGWGNGGGIYLTTCAYEGNGFAAVLYQDDGTLLWSGPGVLIETNSASRFGGGLYAGIYDTGTTQGGILPRLDNALVDLGPQLVRSNTAGAFISDAGYLALPSQIATENVQPVPRVLSSPVLGFGGTGIQGSSVLLDIGIYKTNSVNITGSPAYFPPLYKPILAQ